MTIKEMKKEYFKLSKKVVHLEKAGTPHHQLKELYERLHHLETRMFLLLDAE